MLLLLLLLRVYDNRHCYYGYAAGRKNAKTRLGPLRLTPHTLARGFMTQTHTHTPTRARFIRTALLFRRTVTRIHILYYIPDIPSGCP